MIVNAEQKKAIRLFCEQYKKWFALFDDDFKVDKASIIEWLKETAEYEFEVEIEE